MKPIMFIGLVLVVLGIEALSYIVPYTSREEIDPIEASADIHKTIPLPPILCGLTLVGGIILINIGRTKS